MICRNAAEAFQAGLDALCAHDQDPVLCPACRLTAEEIGAIAILHRGYSATSSCGTSMPHAA